jgi:hypothetical protein
MKLIYKSDKIIFGLVISGCGSLLSGAYIIEQLNIRTNKIYTIDDRKAILSVVFWPITLPYAIFNDNSFVKSIKMIS